jgi:hypothetical protein
MVTKVRKVGLVKTVRKSCRRSRKDEVSCMDGLLAERDP